MKRLLVFVLLSWARLGHAEPNPAALAPAQAPATATRLASGVAWLTLVPGHGAHPGPTDWVSVYGGAASDSRENYYLPRPRQVNNVEPYLDLTGMRVGEKRRYWVPASVWGAAAHVHDVELVAILGTATPQGMPPFPAPSDALRGGPDQRYVVVHPGAAGAARVTEPADRVFFSVAAVHGDGTPFDPGAPRGTVTLGDIQLAWIVDVVRGMTAGEQRYVWTASGGAPLWISVTLYSVEKRAQVPPPADVARAPQQAASGPGLRYLVVKPGTGEPPDAADEVTLDYAVWTTSGRTVETSPKPPVAQAVSWYMSALGAQLTEMRVGERRRIWFSPEAAGYYAEGGAGATAEVTLLAIKRHVDLLPGGLRIVAVDRGLEITRGPTRAPLESSIRHLASVHLASDVVTITGSTECDSEISETAPLTALEALVAHGEAMQLLGAGKVTESIGLFQKAAELAPASDPLQLDLAIAYARAGKNHEAAHVLAARAAHNPVWVYWHVRESPDLAGLAAEPELRRLQARTRGKVDLAKQPVLVEPTGRFLAISVEEGGWGGGGNETRVEIIELASGAIFATIPRVMWSFMDEPMTPQVAAELAARKQRVESWLDDLGFTAPRGLEAAFVSRDAKDVVVFPKAGLVVDDSWTVRRGKQALGSVAGIGGTIHAAYWLPAQRVMAFRWGRAGHEGCEDTDPQGAVVVKLP